MLIFTLAKMGVASSNDVDFKDDITINTGPYSRDKRAATSGRVQNKRNTNKGKISYEDNITAMATTYVLKRERVVTSKESRQFGSMSTELLDQVVDIVMVMSEFDYKQKVRVLEFFKINESSLKMFLKFSNEMRVAYIQKVIFTG